MVKVMYNDKLVYKVAIWVFLGGYFMKREGSFNTFDCFTISLNLLIYLHYFLSLAFPQSHDSIIIIML